MQLDDSHSTTKRPLSIPALGALARVAGDGEMMAEAVRRLERARAAIELEGWLLLQEMRLPDDVEIRHGLLGPGGIVIAVPGGPSPQFAHLEAAGRKALALATLLGVERTDVTAAVVVMDSDDAPNAHFYEGLSAIVVGDRELPDWLSALPVVIDRATLAELRAAIYESAARAAEQKPVRLPQTPRWG